MYFWGKSSLCRPNIKYKSPEAGSSIPKLIEKQSQLATAEWLSKRKVDWIKEKEVTMLIPGKS